jgi:hypothetical protein
MPLIGTWSASCPYTTALTRRSTSSQSHVTKSPYVHIQHDRPDNVRCVFAFPGVARQNVTLIDHHALLGTIIRVYMDDIIIGTSSSVANHTTAVHDVLDLLAEHDLFVKLSKCRFHIPRVNYLGVILEEGVTRMDPIKIAGIKDWPIPKKVKDVRSFLGFCNFYCSFIHGFAHLARPLNLLT